ncbi:DUF554 domain-containing protein [uncultured Granulicatella sp.]|uniref:DUF554 domain-containing protein n=1 Tax=uncultured Granulicatella sp. TaxID=316089 RepID=UPI00262DB044|nr:DUF554 domain-containing protein [uncultured Granulicatella sp.]
MIILINGVAIAVGAIVGVFLRNIIADRFSQHIMQGLALCVFLVGIKGAIQIPSSMIMILSLVFGALVGEGIQMEERVRKFADWLQEKTSKGKETNVNLGEGFVAAVMIFCVGALATMGSIQLGLTGEPTLLQTKSILDGITSIFLAATEGIGVGLSSVAVIAYELILVGLSQFVSPYLSETVTVSMSAVGSLLLVGLAMNLLGITKIKVLNFLPAIFMPIIIVPILTMI